MSSEYPLSKEVSQKHQYLFCFSELDIFQHINRLHSQPGHHHQAPAGIPKGDHQCRRGAARDHVETAGGKTSFKECIHVILYIQGIPHSQNTECIPLTTQPINKDFYKLKIDRNGTDFKFGLSKK